MRINGELLHVMHYYAIENVPSFQALVNMYLEKNEDQPVQLKYLVDTPCKQERTPCTYASGSQARSSSRR